MYYYYCFLKDGSKSHDTVESSPPPDNKLQRDRYNYNNIVPKTACWPCWELGLISNSMNCIKGIYVILLILYYILYVFSTSHIHCCKLFHRHFVAYVINGLIEELPESNTCNSLITAVQEEKMKKAKLLDILNRS